MGLRSALPAALHSCGQLVQRAMFASDLVPQSVQSEPGMQSEYDEPAPPSSHSPSLLYWHVSWHSDGIR